MTTLLFDGFNWDKGNSKKCQKHGVSLKAIEALLQQKDLLIAPDLKHSDTESRFLAIGESVLGKPMFVVFTLRKQNEETLIRPISARYMHDKEIKKYREKRSRI